MDLGLAGKVAIVTGASDGIGKAAAYRLAAEGASVALVSRTASDLEAVAAEIGGETGSTVIAAPADVSNEDAVKSAVEMAADKLGGIDILVNNAGTSSASKFEDMTNEQLDIDFSLKVKGAIYMTRYALPFLKKSDCGAICNTTTPGGKGRGRRKSTDVTFPRSRHIPDQSVVKRVRRLRHPRQHRLCRRPEESTAPSTLGSRQRSGPGLHT